MAQLVRCCRKPHPRRMVKAPGVRLASDVGVIGYVGPNELGPGEVTCNADKRRQERNEPKLGKTHGGEARRMAE
ncbi:hypothetical protein NL676_028302 [Syzygium grande]|nr:hypothetical protein NL676_028302 [Syzygium grande]